DVLTTYADLDADALAIVYELGADDGWRLVNLMQETGVEEPLNDILSYVDPKDGNTYVAGTTSEGVHLFRRDEGGAWTHRELVSEIDGAVPFASGLAQLTSLQTIELADGSGGTIEIDSFTPDGQEGVPTVHFLGIDEDSRLRLFWQDGTVDQEGNYGWAHLDLSNDLFSNTQDAPVFTGRVETYVTSWGGLNFAGLDASGELWSVWYSPSLTWENNGNTNHWHASNLSEITGAPELSGAVSVYLTSWSGINIAGISPGGELVVTWWVPSFGSEWVQTNFSQEFGGPSLATESLSTYVTPWGGLNVVGVDATGDLNVYWWVPSEPGTWNISNLTSGFDAEVARPSGELTTIITPVGYNRDQEVLNSETSILGHDSETGDVIRAFWEPSFGGTWMLENVTELAT
ncbi:MAG: hypothetical protein KDA28_06640, partial [Phycisphaerales bacterium]|nr:hypothetical protein [Phycisphaerales bacterium]